MWWLVAFIAVVAVTSIAKGTGEFQHGVQVLNNCIMVVKDAEAFQVDVMIATTKAVTEARDVPLIPGSNAARVMVMLFRDLFPSCTWPPPAGWTITDTDGVRLTWSEYVDRVDALAKAMQEEIDGFDDDMEASFEPRQIYGEALARAFGKAVGGEAEQRKAERGCNCDGVR